MANQITRSFTNAIAYAWVMGGKDENGVPVPERVGDIEFVATKPNQNDAYRALKNAGVKCVKEFCAFDIVKETVYAMDIDTFIAHAVEVTRLPNGRVLEVADADEGDE